MPKVRLKDLYRNPDSFEDFSEDVYHHSSSSRTQPFFRNKKHRKKDCRSRDRNARQDADEHLY